MMITMASTNRCGGYNKELLFAMIYTVVCIDDETTSCGIQAAIVLSNAVFLYQEE